MKYAEQHRVRNLRIVPGKAEMQVYGQRRSPYRVNIQLKALTSSQWNKITEALGARATYAASLLAGEMPEQIATVFEQCGLPLFPNRLRDLKTNCTCPEAANPCKHIAAAHFTLADALDDDPFLLLSLRGRNKEQVLSELRAARSGEEIADDPIGGPGREHLGISVTQLDPNTFYTSQDDLADYRFHIAQPEMPMPLLRRLGDPNIWGAAGSLIDHLSEVYERVSAFAAELGHSDLTEDETSHAVVFIAPGEDGDEEEEDEPESDFSSNPLGAMLSQDEGEGDDNDGGTVLVRRARRDSPESGSSKRGKKSRRETKESSSARPAAPPEEPQGIGIEPEGPSFAAHRLSRRVAPGTADAGKESTLETRLEMILPITENANIPNGPHVARQIIWALKTHGSATARQLARRTRLKKTAVVQILQSLLAVGLVLQEGQGDRTRYSAPDI